MRIQQHTNTTKTAIGYVRVSTQEQVTEGVSLDAQRDKLKAYCKCSGIKLIDIKADEGISGGTLERPGLQAALAMLRRGTANTLIVVKLDRLSRSLRDVCTLVEDYFGNERYHLLSLCGMANTHSAAGRMVLMNLANYAQFEREMISERTRDALRHMKAQGVRLGPAPYGFALSDEEPLLNIGIRRAAQRVKEGSMPMPVPTIIRATARSRWAPPAANSLRHSFITGAKGERSAANLMRLVGVRTNGRKAFIHGAAFVIADSFDATGPSGR